LWATCDVASNDATSLTIAAIALHLRNVQAKVRVALQEQAAIGVHSSSSNATAETDAVTAAQHTAALQQLQAVTDLLQQQDTVLRSAVFSRSACAASCTVLLPSLSNSDDNNTNNNNHDNSTASAAAADAAMEQLWEDDSIVQEADVGDDVSDDVSLPGASPATAKLLFSRLGVKVAVNRS
jgi:hypothetical protein